MRRFTITFTVASALIASLTAGPALGQGGAQSNTDGEPKQQITAEQLREAELHEWDASGLRLFAKRLINRIGTLEGEVAAKEKRVKALEQKVAQLESEKQQLAQQLLRTRQQLAGAAQQSNTSGQHTQGASGGHGNTTSNARTTASGGSMTREQEQFYQREMERDPEKVARDIDFLQTEGHFDRIDTTGSQPVLWVSEMYANGNRHGQAQIATTVYAHVANQKEGFGKSGGSGDVLLIKQTGAGDDNVFGRFDPVHGLRHGSATTDSGKPSGDRRAAARDIAAGVADGASLNIPWIQDMKNEGWISKAQWGANGPEIWVTRKFQSANKNLQDNIVGDTSREIQKARSDYGPDAQHKTMTVILDGGSSSGQKLREYKARPLEEN